MSIAYLNGQFLPLAEAQVSVLDRGFLFAEAVYEVTAVLDGRLIDSASHLVRLERSAAAIGLSLPVSLAEIEAVQKELAARNDLEEGLIYLQLTRGADAGRDFLPSSALQPTLVMFTQAKRFLDSPAVQNGIAVVTTPDCGGRGAISRVSVCWLKRWQNRSRPRPGHRKPGWWNTAS